MTTEDTRDNVSTLGWITCPECGTRVMIDANITTVDDDGSLRVSIEADTLALEAHLLEHEMS